MVGVTAGCNQAERAFRVVRHAFQEDMPPADLFRNVTKTAAFAGVMRANLVAMLDQLGLRETLGIPTSLALFGDRVDLLPTMSAPRYPVVVADRKNYSGSAPPLARHQILRTYVRDYLDYELSRCPGALVAPLGDRVDEALRDRAAGDLLGHKRLLLGFPHPSGANGHRLEHSHVSRHDLGHRIKPWFSATPGQAARLPSAMRASITAGSDSAMSTSAA